MRPDDNYRNRRDNAPLIPPRSIARNPPAAATQSQPTQPTQPTQQDRPTEKHHQAAGNIARQQIEQIYQKSAADESTNSTYGRTQENPATVENDQWKKYHSAWQDYYQKYYERYYVGQVYKAQQALEQKAQAAQQQTPNNPAGDSANPGVISSQPEAISRNEALYDLRARIRSKVGDSAKKARSSRHFMPIAAAACVVLLFLFLQYNRVLFSNVEAYITPGNVNPANIIVDPTNTSVVSEEPKLVIPKINVDVPVVYDVTPDHASQMEAMEDGVAWFGIPGANSQPGQIGNTVLSGHSSNDIVDSGDYKFIFARLDQLQKGDTIFVNHESTRHTYQVTKKEVVQPTEVDKLIYDTDKPMLTLITCTPLGTSLNRLLVTAEQISPSPSEAQPAPDEAPAGDGQVEMPGNSPTFLERVF